MTVFGPVLCGLLGVAVGVFVNLLIERVPEKKPLMPLRLPRPLTVRYVAVELVTGGLFAAAAVRFGVDAVLPAYLVFFASLVAVSAIDLERRLIPNRIVYPTGFVCLPLLVLAAAVEGEWDRLGTALLGAVLAWAAMFVLHIAVPAGLGFGDVRLSFLLGLFLGWLSLSHVLIGMFLGFLLGAVLGLLLIALRIRSRKDAVPFGPFLAAGAVICILVGNPIVDWWTMSPR